MNPFTNSEKTSKKAFYFDQLSSIKEGAENSRKIEIFEGDDFAKVRAYINSYYSSASINYATKIHDGELWVLNKGAKQCKHVNR